LRFACVVPVVTTSIAVPLIDPEVAVIVALPVATAVASPALLTPMTFELDDTHVLDAVRFCVLPSVYVPVAVSGWLAPVERLAAFGATISDTRVADVTVKVAEAETDSYVPVNVAVP
jgi:hypothetical protein